MPLFIGTYGENSTSEATQTKLELIKRSDLEIKSQSLFDQVGWHFLSYYVLFLSEASSVCFTRLKAVVLVSLDLALRNRKRKFF